jgi:chemotaxis protein CheX
MWPHPRGKQEAKPPNKDVIVTRMNDFAAPFILSTWNVLGTMAMTEASTKGPSTEEDRRSIGDITGFVGMPGEKAKGYLAMSFSKSCVLGIVSNMFGELLTEINDDVVDAVGEITNMVLGGAKNALSKMGYKFGLAVPSVLIGTNIRIARPSGDKPIIIPFNTADGDFYVEFTIREQ